jgi:hypothetical protein
MSWNHWLGARQSPAGNDVSENDTVGIRCPETANEVIEDLVCAVVRSRACELTEAL